MSCFRSAAGICPSASGNDVSVVAGVDDGSEQRLVVMSTMTFADHRIGRIGADGKDVRGLEVESFDQPPPKLGEG